MGGKEGGNNACRGRRVKQCLVGVREGGEMGEEGGGEGDMGAGIEEGCVRNSLGSITARDGRGGMRTAKLNNTGE